MEYVVRKIFNVELLSNYKGENLKDVLLQIMLKNKRIIEYDLLDKHLWKLIRQGMARLQKTGKENVFQNRRALSSKRASKLNKVTSLLVVIEFLELCFPSLFFFQAEDGIRDQPRSRGLGDVYKRQL